MSVLEGLEPKAVFHFFEEIAGIPHGSGNTKQISDYLLRFAQERGLKCLQDESNNVIIWKDGTEGYEHAAPVMLQGHMDMVCEKEDGCDIDFLNDSLTLEVNDGIVSAKGTTLGGDDGIAVAYALAVLDAKDIPHPPLEVVITVDEEIGMLGAAALDASCLKSRLMLNMDSENEGSLLVSCAGGVTVTAKIPLVRKNRDGKRARVEIGGLIGGHSGVEIDKGRANATRELGRVLYVLAKDMDYGLVRVDGGLKDNAIPRAAAAEIVLKEEEAEKAQEIIDRMNEVLRHEYRLTDPDITLSLRKSDNTEVPMDEGSMARVVIALVNFPGGIQKMSFDIEGLVQTSLNLGITKTGEDEIEFSFSVRSSVESERDELVDRIECLMRAIGGSVSTMGQYPAWEYKQDSPLRDIMVGAFEEQYGHKPEVYALHAGVECGLFAGKMPGLDAVSFGPDMKDIHTPKESLDAKSVERTWKYLLCALKKMK